MDAQLRKAEMKVDQARNEASMALRAAQQDASQGSPAQLREAQEHEKHALQALAKAELEERHEASVYRRRADGEHRQVVALKGELERIEDQVLEVEKKPILTLLVVSKVPSRASRNRGTQCHPA